MFIILLLLGTTYLVTTAALRGPRAAATSAFVLSLALPCWVYFESGALRIDIRTALALVGLGCVLLHPLSQFSFRPIIADLLLATLVVVQIVSDCLTTDVTPAVAVDIAIQWFVPYALGRIAVRSADDVRRLMPGMVVVCLALSLWSAVESITRINPIGSLVGHVGSIQGMQDLRWGLRRAEGPLTHPIFFGLLLVMLLPFAMQAARMARNGTGPRWWTWTPWCIAGGTLFSMSRGPQMGIGITLLTMFVVLSSRWRAAVLLPVTLFVALGLTAGHAILDVFHSWSGETDHRLILMKGELVPYTGTTHRLLQVEVYADAVAEAGWLGFGSAPLRAGETKIPHVEEHLRQMFSSIDNHYLQFALQVGYLGLGTFVLFCFFGMAYAASCTNVEQGEFRLLFAGITGSLVALTLLMASVWLAGDYRFALLALVGFAGGAKLSLRQTTTEIAAPPPTVPALRLSPGHPLLSSPT